MRSQTGKPTLTKNEYNEFASKLLWCIGKGKKNAVHLRELQEKLGRKDDRKIRLAIKELSKTLPIISGDEGYYWCETRDELDEFVLYHRKEIISRCIMLRETRKVCGEWLGKNVQLHMI